MRALLILLAAIAIALWHFMTTRPIAHAAGVVAGEDPRQTELEQATAISDREFKLYPRAQFSADARVLSRERYSQGKLADIVPLDIAVGWGRMSDSDVLEKLEITQGNRFYYWHYENEPPIPRAEIEAHSANWHIVPASDGVWKSLKNVRVGAVVHLEGLLVDIDGPEIGQIRTSLTRSDTGAGACEIIYVESATVSAY
jgi:hypothetical protein